MFIYPHMPFVFYAIILLVMYYMNYLASATTTLGTSMMDLATVFPFPYMPPGVVFMVAWTTIFVLLAVFLIVARRHYARTWQTQSRIMMLFAATCITNMLWIVVTGMGWYVIAALLIAWLWRQLFLMLDIYKKRFLQKTFWRYTFGAYYGWISIATGALTLSQLAYIVSPYLWLNSNIALTPIRIAIILAIGIGITLCSRMRWKNIAALVFALWALGGAIWALVM